MCVCVYVYVWTVDDWTQWDCITFRTPLKQNMNERKARKKNKILSRDLNERRKKKIDRNVTQFTPNKI